MRLAVVLDTSVVLRAVEALSSLDNIRFGGQPLPSEGQRLEPLSVLTLAVFGRELEPVAGPTLLGEYRNHLRRLRKECEPVPSLLEMLKDECRVVEPREDFVRACQNLDVYFRGMANELERRGMPLEVYGPLPVPPRRVTASRGGLRFQPP